MSFTLRLPNSENPHLRNNAPILSRHATLEAAHRAFLRHQVSAAREGHRSEAYIWDEDRNCLAEEAAPGRPG